MNRGRSAALCGRLIPLFDARLADASGSAASRFWSICFMRFRMRCNLKTAPNIGEVSFVSAIGPLLEWNVPVFPMASRRSRAPQTGACLEGGHGVAPAPLKICLAPPCAPPTAQTDQSIHLWCGSSSGAFKISRAAADVIH